MLIKIEWPPNLMGNILFIYENFKTVLFWVFLISFWVVFPKSWVFFNLTQQLKQLKFKEEILINLYRSITRSFYNTMHLSSYRPALRQNRNAQHWLLKIIGISWVQAYEKYNIPTIETFIEKSCVNIVARILKYPSHPLTQAQHQLPQPKHFTRNSKMKLTKVKKVTYDVLPICTETEKRRIQEYIHQAQEKRRTNDRIQLWSKNK